MRAKEGAPVSKGMQMNRRGFLLAAGAGLGAAAISLPPPMLVRMTGSVLPAAHTPDPASWSDSSITLAWLGHATVLINFFGVRVLTDPALFPRIGVDVRLTTLGPLRLTACALPAAQLPDIDVVLLSHAHFDHLDTASLGALRGHPVVVSAPKTADLVPRSGVVGVHEIRWNQAAYLRTRRGDLEVRAVEVKHWGARLNHDGYRGYNGYVIRREGRTLLFGGDTALTRAFAEHRRHGPYEAAIMPIGAYDPYIDNHCTPEQAVAMADAAGARLFAPIHHKTFRLSEESFNEPIERAEAALVKERDRLAMREVGDTVVLV
jgi:L-ascorbate metabolism protein UlaG (beta-lactamase superfamily)